MMNVVDDCTIYSLYKQMTMRLEDKPVARFWKKVVSFNSKNALNEYCSLNNIVDVHENQFVVDGKIEYLT